jgi:hypothetical protein
VSGSRASGLLRLYPAAWRARYGEELQALLVESSAGGRVPWRARLDVALAGGRERLRAAGLAGDGLPPHERARSGSLLVLCAWALFVVGGAGVQKFSEHWQGATPAAGRGVPSGAFLALVVTAAIGSVLVLAGVASAAPSLLAFLRGGGWPAIRGRVLTAAFLSCLTVAAMAPLVGWAHVLTVRQRNGLDLGYGIAFGFWVALAAAGLLAWTGAAVSTARQLSLPATTLRYQARVASAVTVAMAVMTTATAVWWAALASSAPWFLAGRPVGSAASPLAPQLLAAATLMLVATLLGALGAFRSVTAR